MNVNCPHCEFRSDYISDFRTVVRIGHFHRTSDSKDLQRYRCLLCKKTFSEATKDPCFRQKKRQKNKMLSELIASGVSERRSARLLRINRTTVARKIIFLGARAAERLFISNASLKVNHFQFDDLETFEHSRHKPLSVTLAVTGQRHLLGLRVASMPAKGGHAKKAIQRYGPRHDGRSESRKQLFMELKPIVAPGALIQSDSNPHYVNDVKRFFPGCYHLPLKGQRGSRTGQGEIKAEGFDPLFALNHTCAMIRENICNLVRKTWCTTKKRERLADRLAIYALYHNQHLKSA